MPPKCADEELRRREAERGTSNTQTHTHHGWPWARGNMQPLEASVGESPPEPADGGPQTPARDPHRLPG